MMGKPARPAVTDVDLAAQVRFLQCCVLLIHSRTVLDALSLVSYRPTDEAELLDCTLDINK